MRRTVTALVLLLSACTAPTGKPPPLDPTISKEVGLITTTTSGPVELERVYRGKSRILITATYTNRATRLFYYNGEQRFIEADNDGDGFFETIEMHGRNPWEFERFTRDKDGTIEPIPEQEYLKSREEMKDWTTNVLNSLKQENREAK